MSTPLNGLFCEIQWGPEVAEARSFPATQQTIRIAPDERADLPAYGFEIPDEGQLLAERTGDGHYRIHLPPSTVLYRERKGQPRVRVGPEELLGPPERRTFLLGADDAVSAVVPSRDLRLRMVPSVVDRQVGRGNMQRLASAAILIGGTLMLPFAFLTFSPNPQTLADLRERALLLDQEKKARQLRAIEKAYPSHIDEDAAPLHPEDGRTLPGRFRTR